MNRYNLVLLIIGIASGILMGPWVLGHYAPTVHQRMLVGGLDAGTRLVEFDAHHDTQRKRLVDSGASPAAVSEFDRKRQPERQRLVLEARLAQTEHEKWLLSHSVAILLVVIVTYAIERRVGQTPIRRRLSTARYAMIAVWIALGLAGPVWRYTPVVFIAVLGCITLAAALIPASAGDEPA